MNERATLKINAKGHLEIGGADCVGRVKQFSTPLYVFDEAHIRAMMRVYKKTINEEYGGNGQVLYASKELTSFRVESFTPRSKRGSPPKKFTFTATTSCLESSNLRLTVRWAR